MDVEASTYTECEHRLACLKLAQASWDKLSLDCSINQVLERAALYTDFVSEPLLDAEEDEAAERMVTEKLERALIDELFEDEQPTPTTALTFGGALHDLKFGQRVSRAGWNGKDMWLELQKPTENNSLTLPYIYMRTVQGDFVPWLASQTDLLAEDWFLV